MHEAGFEPAKALSHQILSLAPLTAWVPVQLYKHGKGMIKRVPLDASQVATHWQINWI